MFQSPQRLTRIQPPWMVLDWAPHPICAPDIALQLRMALASAWPTEGSVAAPHDPSGATVTAVQSSWSSTMASAGMTRHAAIIANACNRLKLRERFTVILLVLSTGQDG